jgi:hypothetical protein
MTKTLDLDNKFMGSEADLATIKIIKRHLIQTSKLRILQFIIKGSFFRHSFKKDFVKLPITKFSTINTISPKLNRILNFYK